MLENYKLCSQLPITDAKLIQEILQEKAKIEPNENYLNTLDKIVYKFRNENNFDNFSKEEIAIVTGIANKRYGIAYEEKTSEELVTINLML